MTIGIKTFFKTFKTCSISWALKHFFNFLDDTKNGVVRFGDGSTINYEGKGRIHVPCSDGNTLLLSIIYAP